MNTVMNLTVSKEYSDLLDKLSNYYVLMKDSDP
jgi:hypothetical protein